MSNLREKAREIHEAGVAERGTFTADGAPLRMYKYWLRHSHSSRAFDVQHSGKKENFCHFWRVVAFWGPLMFLKQFFTTHVEKKLIVAILILLAISLVFGGTLAWDSMRVVVFWFLGTAAAISVGLVGILSGVSMTMTDERIEDVGLIPRKYAKFGVIALPFFALGYGITKLSDWEHFDDLVVWTIGTLVAVAVIGLFTLAIVESGFWVTLAYLGGLILAFIAFIALGAGLSMLGEFIKGKRAVAQRNARKRRDAYYAEHGVFPEDVEREPGAIAKFFTGIADFCVLLAQVVRTKKWKICPTVEIDTAKAP